jgi:ketosteroid isomerase-like protein
MGIRIGIYQRPLLQRRQGREAVAGFFASLGEIQMHRFVPKDFFEGGGTVVVLLDVEFTVTSTGKRVTEEDEIHVWRFDPEGKVIRFRHGADTHQHELAYSKS